MRASWLGGVFLASDLAMFISSVKLTSVVDATVITAMQPALVLMVSRRLFGEHVGRWDVFWIVLAMSGVVAAVLGSGATSHHQLVGDLLAVGALLCWSAYWLVSKHARVVHNAMEYTAGVAIVAAVVVTPLVLLVGDRLTEVRAGDWLWISLLTVGPGLGNLVMNWAHRYVYASISSVIGCLSPLVAAVAAKVLLNQSMTLFQISGVIGGLVSVTVVTVRHRNHSAQ